MGDPGRVVREARVVGERVLANRLAERAPRGRALHRHEQFMVEGCVGPVGRERRVRTAHRRGTQTGTQQFGDARTLDLERGLEHRYLDLLAQAGAVAIQQGREDRHRRHRGGREVEEAGEAEGLDRIARCAVCAREAGERLHDRIGAAGLRQRPGLAEAGDRAVDQTRVGRAHCVVAEAQALDHAAAEVLHEHVAGAEQLHALRPALGRLQVDDHALLVHVHRQVVGAHPALGRHHPARAVAGRRLDLDHLGAEHAEQGAGPRTGGHDAHVHHAQAGQRPRTPGGAAHERDRDWSGALTAPRAPR